MQGYIRDFPREGALNLTGGGIPIFGLFYLTNSTELKGNWACVWWVGWWGGAANVMYTPEFFDGYSFV